MPRRPFYKNPLVWLAQVIIRGYQVLLSPWVGQQCRYHPTCSCYAHQSYEKHGFWKGTILTLLRIFSCHPYSKRPWTDPVPEQFAWRDILRYKHSEQSSHQ